MTPIRHTAFASSRARIRVGIIAIPSLPQVGFSAKAKYQINDNNSNKNTRTLPSPPLSQREGSFLLHLCRLSKYQHAQISTAICVSRNSNRSHLDPSDRSSITRYRNATWMCKICANLSDTKLTEKCVKIEPNYRISCKIQIAKKLQKFHDSRDDCRRGWVSKLHKFDTCANSVSAISRGMARSHHSVRNVRMPKSAYKYVRTFGDLFGKCCRTNAMYRT